MKKSIVIFLFLSIAYTVAGQAKSDTKVFGKVNGYELFYKSYDSLDINYITIYAAKKNIKKALGNFSDEGFYADNAAVIKLKEASFIYIHFDHTSGNSDGKLYYLNTMKMKMSEVRMQKNTYKLPENLSAWKGYGLAWDGKHFTTGSLLGSEASAKGYELTTDYKLIKISKGHYVLKPIHNSISENTD